MKYLATYCMKSNFYIESIEPLVANNFYVKVQLDNFCTLHQVEKDTWSNFCFFECRLFGRHHKTPLILMLIDADQNYGVGPKYHWIPIIDHNLIGMRGIDRNLLAMILLINIGINAAISIGIKDVPGGFPKSDLLGVTVALIHSRGNWPYSCKISVLQVSYGKKWLKPLGTSLIGNSINDWGSQVIIASDNNFVCLSTNCKRLTAVCTHIYIGHNIKLIVFYCHPEQTWWKHTHWYPAPTQLCCFNPLFSFHLIPDLQVIVSPWMPYFVSGQSLSLGSYLYGRPSVSHSQTIWPLTLNLILILIRLSLWLYEDSLDHCPMPINADQNCSIDLSAIQYR